MRSKLRESKSVLKKLLIFLEKNRYLIIKQNFKLQRKMFWRTHLKINSSSTLYLYMNFFPPLFMWIGFTVTLTLLNESKNCHLSSHCLESVFKSKRRLDTSVFLWILWKSSKRLFLKKSPHDCFCSMNVFQANFNYHVLRRKNQKIDL